MKDYIENSQLRNFIKACCVHEAGHASLAFNFNAPIHFVELIITMQGRKMAVSGLTEHDMGKFIQENAEGVSQFKSYLVFYEYLKIMWGGMAAENVFYPSRKCTQGAEGDLDRITKMVNLLPEPFFEKGNFSRKEVAEIAAIEAKKSIQENRQAIEKLSDKMFLSLSLNNFSIKLEGSKVTEILERG